MGKTFSGSSEGMDGKSFVKLCKDCGLINKSFTATDADLAFAKVVGKGQRRISFPQFEHLLQLVAQKKGTDLEQMLADVMLSEGPILNGTRADAVRFHDDKHTYTGTHVNGGPESVPMRAGTAIDQSWKRL